jgi:hypothetical protein
MQPTEQVSTKVEPILSFLKGDKSSNKSILEGSHPGDLARCIQYSIKQKHHRDSLISSIIYLLNVYKYTDEKEKQFFRSIAWNMLQQIPQSYLIEIPGILKKNKWKSTKRLRQAIVYSLIQNNNQIVKSFMLGPEKYRELFSYLRLPKEKIKNMDVKNPKYISALNISLSTTDKIVESYGVKKLVKFLPLHLLMQHITNPEDVYHIAENLRPDDYFRHAQWFRQILGDDTYSDFALIKADQVTDPLSFLRIKDHLDEKGLLTKQITESLETRSTKILEDIISKYQLERIAIVVDISGSMDSAKEITIKLYEAFSKLGNKINMIISFNDRANVIRPEELVSLRINGSTAMGSAFMLLASSIEKMSEQDKPQAIILVSDLGENGSVKTKSIIPYLKEVSTAPLIILKLPDHWNRIHAIDVEGIFLDYPRALLEVRDFHERLVNTVIEEIARLSSKVAVEEKKVTQVVKVRTPIEEIIGEIQLIPRPEETLQPGYFVKLLTTN